jgi:hypothetical protein
MGTDAVDGLPPERAGKTSMWANSRGSGKRGDRQAGPRSTQPPHPAVGSLDTVRAVFWHAYRHLFPPHSLAAQTQNGSVLISWSIMEEPGAKYPYAAPVMLRFDEELVQTMWRVGPDQRLRIAEKHEPTLREGLRGYDPYSRFPNARVVNIG